MPFVPHAVSGLADRTPGRIRFHKAAQIILQVQPPFHFNTLGVGNILLGRSEVNIIAVKATLADADFLIFIGLQICLNNIHLLAAGILLQLCNIRILNQEFAFHFSGLRLTQESGDFFDQPHHLFFKIRAVVNDLKMGMAGPGGDKAVVQIPRLLDRFISGGIIAKGIEFFRPLGSCDQMKDRVIGISEVNFIPACLLQDRIKFLLGHISTVVQFPSVTNNKNLLIRHSPGSLFKHILFEFLQPHLDHLILRVAAAGPWSNTAGNQFRCRLRYKKDLVTFFRKCVLYPAHGGRFARAGSAG